MNSLESNGDSVLNRLIRSSLALLMSAYLSGCHSNPINIAQVAAENRWDLSYQKGQHYPTVLASSRFPSRNSMLHVYIEGDGLPWQKPFQISSDPTPRNPVALNLMKYDQSHAIYLGRPCYFGLQHDPRCNPSLWTNARYSEQIVGEMNETINAYLVKHGLRSAVVVGFSGGGTLALLLANRNPQIKGTLLIAPNFNTVEWARLHGYTPLYTSLNPATEVKRRTFRELFWFGEDDENVPSASFARMAESRKNAHVRIFTGADHACCWEEQARSGVLDRALLWIEGSDL